uniref:ATP synthase F0 subunit 8 n=1 Tax=Hemiodoecus leai TaxID=1254501 RepID=A0A0U1XI43_9HEMI|nr:ATP synthase F0 subunit 8 [Hemiodoecus leai]AIS38307.1 ATP synthase F0 subunit 8 [Hemiodoecus leai]
MPQMFPSPLIILFIYFLSIMLVLTTSVYFNKIPSLNKTSLKNKNLHFKW